MNGKKKKTEHRAAFRPGSGGVCEAELWKFSAPQDPYIEEEPESHMVAAESIYEALNYIRRRERDFRVNKAECIGMIAMLSGSPLD